MFTKILIANRGKLSLTALADEEPMRARSAVEAQS